MFYRAALDINEKNGTLNKGFISCVRFVADVANPAVFYIRNDWWLTQEVLRKLDWNVNDLTPEQRHLLKKADYPGVDRNQQEMPTLVYLLEGSWDKPADPETGAMSGLIIPKREFVLSASEVVHKASLRDNGLNAQTAILCLAAVGLEVMLPNVAFNLLADEEIDRIKNDLKEERHKYLEVAAGLAQQSYEGLKEGDYFEVLRWAESEVAFKLAPKARILEEATSSIAARQLRKAGYSFWQDGVPAIGSALATGGIVPAGIATAEAALKTLVETLSISRSERLLPEISYAMKISRALKKVS